MSFKNADEEFQTLAKTLYEQHKTNLGLNVPPDRVIFLRSSKKKNVYAYCRRIFGELTQLTDKWFFIVIINENYDPLTDIKKKYVILHELKHLFYDDEKEKTALLKHSIEGFADMLVNSNWNLDLIK